MKKLHFRRSHVFRESPAPDQAAPFRRVTAFLLCGLAAWTIPFSLMAGDSKADGADGNLLTFRWKSGGDPSISRVEPVDKPGWSENAVKWIVHVPENIDTTKGTHRWTSVIMPFTPQDWSTDSSLHLRIAHEQTDDNGRKIIFFYTNNGVRVDNPPSGVDVFVLGDEGTTQTLDLTLGSFERDSVNLVSFGIDLSAAAPGDHVFYIDDLRVGHDAPATP
ncbi:MAG: hypothetical protein BGO12_13125 [Verrucomicrobia bacterium 61-8]|nr:MAG: hypothetical protein BGO12_13125 [Verrucomicrobia bacterium 61-8]